MKRKLLIFLIALFGAFCSLSCAKSEFSFNPAPAGKKVHFVVKSGVVKSFIEYDSQTKKYSPFWNKGDELGLYFTSSEQPSALDATLVNIEENGIKASFEGDVTAPQSEGYFYSFTPASRLNSFYSDKQFGFNLGDPAGSQYIQHPSKSSFDPLCDLLLAKPCYYIEDGGEVLIDDLYFSRMFAVLKVNLVGNVIAGEVINSLKITADAQVPLCGRVAVDPVSYSLKNWTVSKPYVWAEYDTQDKPVAGTDAVYLVVNPQVLSEGVVLTIEGDTDNNTIVKTVTLQGPMEFRQGNVSILNLSISAENCTPKVKSNYMLQTKDGVFESGAKYIFAFKDGISGRYHFLKSTSDSDNIVEAALDVEDGLICSSDANYMFEAVAGETEGMFCFKNVRNGKFIYNSGTGTALETASQDERTEWSPVFLPASGTYKLLSSRYISVGVSTSAAKAYVDKLSTQCKDQVSLKIALSQYCGAISVFKLYTGKLVLDTPSPVAGEVTKNSVSATWEPVPYASAGYQCQILKGDVLIAEKSVDASPVVFDNLTPGTGYVIKVRANAVEGKVPFSQSDFGTIEISTSLPQVEDIKASGTYHLTNLLVYSVPKTNTAILGDETGKILLYSVNHGLSAGDMLDVSGSVVEYDGVWEFNGNLTISKLSSGNPVNHGEACELCEIPAYSANPSIVYVHFKGNQSGLNITTTGGTYTYLLRLSTASSSTDGCTVDSKGYAYGYNSTYSNIDYQALSIVKVPDSPTTMNSDWMELPATVEGSSYIHMTMRASGVRNYSICYDKTMYASIWSAYPLHKSHLSGSTSSSWSYNPNISQSYQISVTKSSYGSVYGHKEYSRGHCVPNADRKSSSSMNSQTYYVTNQTPQLQDKFNSGIWSQLEGGIRSVVTSYSDTVYVVTGVAYRKAGGSETISYISKSTANPPSLPVPNYFWKAVLKVKRSGGKISSACTVGVWFEHKQYSSTDYTNYTVSVDQIEAWTGLNLFANLPETVQTAAETNSNWSTFSQFK